MCPANFTFDNVNEKEWRVSVYDHHICSCVKLSLSFWLRFGWSDTAVPHPSQNFTFSLNLAPQFLQYMNNLHFHLVFWNAGYIYFAQYALCLYLMRLTKSLYPVYNSHPVESTLSFSLSVGRIKSKSERLPEERCNTIYELNSSWQ